MAKGFVAAKIRAHTARKNGQQEPKWFEEDTKVRLARKEAQADAIGGVWTFKQFHKDYMKAERKGEADAPYGGEYFRRLDEWISEGCPNYDIVDE